jgi:hypothetical protein
MDTEPRSGHLETGGLHDVAFRWGRSLATVLIFILLLLLITAALPILTFSVAEPVD